MKKIAIIATLLSWFTYSSLSFAQGNPAEAVKNLIAGYGENHRKEQRYADKGPTEPKDSLYYISESLEINYFLSQVFKTMFFETKGLVNFPALNPLAKDNEKMPKTLADNAIFSMLTATSQSVDTAVNNLASPSPTTPSPLDFFRTLRPESVKETNIFGQSEAKKAPTTAPINLDSLITPVQYPRTSGEVNEKQQSALLFINFITGVAQPMPSLNLAAAKNAKERDDILNTPSVKKYFVAFLRQIANYSVGISNFYYLYAERVPIPTQNRDIPSGLKLPEYLTKEASPLAIDQYSATRRIQSKEWYQEMQTTTPATIQREMLYLLAEMRYELFQLRMVNERLLATESAMQIKATNDNLPLLRVTLQNACATLPAGVCPPAASGNPGAPQ
jgi:hypothetical protein